MSTRRVFVVLVMAATLLVAIPGTASAELTDLPDETWGVVGLYDSLTTSTPAEVMAIEQIGNTIYVGGQFLEVVRKRNEPHHDQRFLAAFDATSGDWIDWWRPDINGPVFALEASPDGSRLYVGGEFTNVEGIGDTEGLVAIDPATGKVDRTFTAQIEGAANTTSPGVVRTIRATSSSVYVGGSFNFVTGPDLDTRMRVNKTARLSTNGTPDTTWRPKVLDGSVWGMDIDESRNRVYLAGFFDSIDNIADTGNFIAVNATTGAPLTNLDRFPIFTESQPHQFDVLVDGNSVWVVGTQHLIHKLDANDLSIDRRWFTGFEPGFHIGGDFQSLGILDDEIYATCHCWGVIRELPNSVTTLEDAQDEPVDGEVQGIVGFKRSNGDWNSNFLPDIFGQIGGWAVNGGGDGCLWVGGDLNRRSQGDTWRNGVVRWCDEAGQGPPVGPPLEEPPDTSEPNRPTRPKNPSVRSGPGADVTLSWSAASDDTAVATYVVYRNGVEAGRTRRTEIHVAAGGLLSVQAVDPSGNKSGFSDPIPTSAALPDVLGHWPLDTTAIDMSGNENHGTIDGARNTAGRIVDGQRLGQGDSIDIAANQELEIGAGNGNFTVSGWLRVETGPTGTSRNNISAAGVATLGTASNSNRVVARIETSGGPTTAVSGSPLQLNQWAHVALVRTGGNMRLYVDGALESTEGLAGTTTAGSGAMTLTGARAVLDDIMVHAGALTAAQVADLATPSFPDGPLAYYPLEGDATDKSGNGFDGVVSGTTTTSGVHGQALSFNGQPSDKIVIADDPSLRPGANDSDFTVSYWMKLQDDFTGSWRSITHKGNSSAERTFAMWLRPSDDRIHFRISTDQSSNLGSDSVSEVPVGEWTHITYVKRGNKLSLYFNGELDNSVSLAGNVVANDGDIYIAETPWFNGTEMVVDDYRIYSYGLDDVEAQALAGATPPPPPTPPPAPAEVVIIKPGAGDVTKNVKISVDATSAIDGLGELDVDVKFGGTWKQASWNNTAKKYQYIWDSTSSEPGPVTVRARATESNGTVTTASTVQVDVKADYGSLVIADGAVAYWRLNDGGTFAKDFTGGDHKARFNGTSPLASPLIGEGGKSTSFAGDDLITVGNNVDLNTANSYFARSIELWFKPTDETGRHVLWEEGGSQHGISLYTKAGKLHAGAWNRTGNNAWSDDVFVNHPFSANEVYHVVMVVKPNTGHLKLFVNGVKVRQKGGVGAIDAHSGGIGIGGRNGATRFHDTTANGGTGGYLKGKIDEVAIYNKALTLAHAEAHFLAAQD